MPTTPRARAGRIVGAVLALLLVAVTSACTDDGTSSSDDTASAGSSGAAGGGTLRLGVRELASLDPSQVAPVDQGAMIALDLLFDTLPDLAEVTHNADHTVWTASLGEASFSDGSPVTASDAAFSLERLARQGSGSLAGARLDLIVGYEAYSTDPSVTTFTGLNVVDESTLEITLREPFVELPALLSSPLFGVVPKAAVQADPAGFAAEPVGSGPYHPEGAANGGLHLTRAEGADVQIDDVELLEFETIEASYEAFRDGEVDWSLVPADQLDEAADEYGDDHFAPFGAELWFGINQVDPAYSDLRFRQAIVHAIDRHAVAEEVFPGRLPLDGLVVDGVPGAVEDPCGADCEYDPDASRELLREIYGEGPITTVILDTYDDPDQIALIEAITEDLQEVGIPVEHRVQSFEEYRRFVVTGEADVFSFGWVGIVGIQDSYLGPPFISDSPDNVVGLGSTGIDGQIREARGAGLDADRQRIYQDVERQILGFGVVIPIAQLRTNQVVSDRVEGFVAELDGTFDVSSVRLAG